jgi:hypothetical protein
MVPTYGLSAVKAEHVEIAVSKALATPASLRTVRFITLMS